MLKIVRIPIYIYIYIYIYQTIDKNNSKRFKPFYKNKQLKCDCKSNEENNTNEPMIMAKLV